MSLNKNIDLGLRDTMQDTVRDPEQPFLNRLVAGTMLIAARGLVDEMSDQNKQLPEAPKALPAQETKS